MNRKKPYNFLLSASVVLVIAVLYLTLNYSENDPRTGFDKPEGYHQYFQTITTPLGKEESGYQANYALSEYRKALKNQGPSLKSAIDYNWVQRGPGNVGGRTRTVLIDPDDYTGRTWFAGSVSGGIWKTTNAGDTWTNLTPELPNLSTATLAMSSANTNVIYAGTGEGYGGEGMVSGNGIYKSIDKGETWDPIESIKKDEHFRFVNKLWVSPNSEDVLLAATNRGIFKTIDGGATWDSVFTKGYVVQDIVQNPLNENVLYAGVNSLGVCKSFDQGNTWQLMNDGMTELYRVSLSVSSIDTSYVFAGVEAPGNQTHIYHSRNGGESWQLNFNTDGLYVNFHKQQGWFNNVVAAHPFEKNKVFVGGVHLGMLEFSNGTYTSSRDVIRVDTVGTAKNVWFVNYGGPHFSGALSTGLNEDAEVEERDFVNIEIRFGSGNKQKAHRFTVPDGEGAGVPPHLYNYEDYVEVPFQAWDTENNIQLMISFRDQDRNGKFNLTERQYDDDISGREYIYVHAYPYSETNPREEIAAVGGFEQKMLYFMWPTLPTDGEWDETNLSEGIVQIKYGSIQLRDAYTTILADDRLNEELHVDHHDIQFFVPDVDKDSFVIVEANDGGLGFSPDGGKTWTQIDEGYLTTQFYGVAKRPNEHEYIGGMQDNGTWQSPLNTDAQETSLYEFRIEGDGFEALWHPWYPQRIIASSYNNFIKISNDYGETWQWIDDKVLGDGPFITKISHSKDNPDLIFCVGSRGVYRNSNFGFGTSPWELIDLGDTWAINNVVTSSHHVKVSEANPAIVWAGGGMYKKPDLNISISKDYGRVFDTVTSYLDDEMGYISGMATHPTNEAEAFITFSYRGKPKIIRTYDYGNTWKDITGFSESVTDTSINGFPDVIVHDVLVLPNDTNTIWAGTEIGLFESIDNGQSWHYANSGLPAVSIWQMDIIDGHIVVATHGRGIWTADLGLINRKEYKSDLKVKLYPNPANDVVYLDDYPSNPLSAVSIYSLEGKSVYHEVYSSDQNYVNELKIAHLAPGNYIVFVQFRDGQSTSSKLVIRR